MSKAHIPNRKKDEKIILLLRRHPFVIAIKIGFWLVVAIMPLALYLIMSPAVDELLNHQIFQPLLIMFISIYYLYVWLFIFQSFVDYYLDIWIVTSHRIINIEQKGLFFRTVSEQNLYRVQDVTSELKGFFSTMFDYGTVYIQTAGEEVRFIFRQVPHPYQVAEKIGKIVEESKRFNKMMESEDKITIN
ncbi:MAG: PH domain-containing protein [Patescibacteria group bacterium]|jgi:ABC-type multidrug transport system fused ATPase/permease subunit|nr:PH domain-containing protein [Patescibacteria group bacterium]